MIFLGPLFRKEEEPIIEKKTKHGRPQNQANTFQWNCIDGFIENGEELSILNVLPVGSYPKYYGDIILKERVWKYKECNNREIGCINIPPIKQLTREAKAKKELRTNDEKVIIIYSTYLPFLKAVQKLSSYYTVVLIVADLPELYDYSSTTSALKKILRKYNNKKIYKCLERIDGFVLLTEQMKEPLKVGNRPYVIVEGLCGGIDETILIDTAEDRYKSIVYTGSLNKCFGIATLVEAFKLTKDETYRLRICGSGDYEEEIKRAAKSDNRIEFLGVVNRDTALKLQKNATVLINPRNNDGEFTKYSFPSKTMEYLQSEVPTVAYKLDGIPDEYDEYINYVEDNSPESMKELIEAICKDEHGIYIERAKRAKSFVEIEKNNITQTKKIMKMIEELY